MYESVAEAGALSLAVRLIYGLKSKKVGLVQKMQIKKMISLSKLEKISSAESKDANSTSSASLITSRHFPDLLAIL